MVVALFGVFSRLQLVFVTKFNGFGFWARHGLLVPAVCLSILFHLIAVYGFSTGRGVHRFGQGGALTVTLVSSKKEGGLMPNGGVSEEKETLQQSMMSARRKVGRGPGVEREILDIGPEADRLKDDRKAASVFWPVEATSIRPYPITIFEEILTQSSDFAELYGRSLLRVSIDMSGEVQAIEALESDMPSGLLDAVLVAFKRMRFIPAYRDGVPVNCFMVIEVGAEDFRLMVQ